jgi:pimeloyl-ACP methyl ester carboxylesterase
LGYFGSGMGGAAVLISAARRGEEIRAIVCRSARTDLARSTLAALHAPTLLLAGREEPALIKLNQAACEAMRGPKALQQVGVSDALETLDEIAKAAGDWFDSHMVTR